MQSPRLGGDGDASSLIAEVGAPSANLRTADKITIAQVAKYMAISERSVYMALAVQRRSPALADEVAHGNISVHAAYATVAGKTGKTAFDRLLSAWHRASDDDRERFLSRLALELSGDLAPSRAAHG